jgi:hypothetical protein
MKKLSTLLAAALISAASVTAFAQDAAPMTKTRADVVAELTKAIKTGDLMDPFTHKTYKELYPAKYPMSDADAGKMAKDMMMKVPMGK